MTTKEEKAWRKDYDERFSIIKDFMINDMNMDADVTNEELTRVQLDMVGLMLLVGKLRRVV